MSKMVKTPPKTKLANHHRGGMEVLEGGRGVTGGVNLLRMRNKIVNPQSCDCQSFSADAASFGKEIRNPKLIGNQ